MMAITTSSSINVNALEDERLVFTPRNWYAEKLPAWPSARNIKVVPVPSARFWVSSWDTGFRGFTFKRGCAKSRRVKRGMMSPLLPAQISKFLVRYSIFFRSVLGAQFSRLATALHIKKEAGHLARPLVCVLFLVKPTKLLAHGATKLHRFVGRNNLRTHRSLNIGPWAVH